MSKAIEEFIARHIADKRGLPLNDIQHDADLFESGYVDSLGVFNMVMSLEDEFGIRFAENDLVDPRMSTVSGIAEIIQTKRHD